MSISAVGSASAISIQAVMEMRNQLDDLQRQLGSGKKSTTYAGLGIDRGLTVGLRSQLSAISGYQDTITQVGVRLDLMQQSLQQLGSQAQTEKSTILNSQFVLNGGTQTQDQKDAFNQLDQAIALLNTSAGDRYLFSGRSVDQQPVETADHIVNGDGTRAGLKQVMAERKLADLGPDGLGRLTAGYGSPTTSSVSLAEDSVSPFGFKLVGAVPRSSAVTVTGPAGVPPALSVDLGATNPSDGDTIRFSFTLPDGSSQDLTLTATSSAPPGPGQFLIGASSDITASNLKDALSQGLATLGQTALVAASAVAAGNDFFNADSSHPPQRVAGPPFDTATALVDGTDTNTVNWYLGEAGSDPARSTAIARVDRSLTVPYGVRANEQALRNVVQSIAVFATASFSGSDPNAQDQYAALRQRVGAALVGTSDQQKVTDIQGELASAQFALNSAKDRHQQTDTTLQNLLQGTEGVTPEQLAAQILALQTSLQATLQTTAMLLQTNLLQYLPPG